MAVGAGEEEEVVVLSAALTDELFVLQSIVVTPVLYPGGIQWVTEQK